MIRGKGAWGWSLRLLLVVQVASPIAAWAALPTLGPSPVLASSPSGPRSSDAVRGIHHRVRRRPQRSFASPLALASSALEGPSAAPIAFSDERPVSDRLVHRPPLDHPPT